MDLLILTVHWPFFTKKLSKMLQVINVLTSSGTWHVLGTWHWLFHVINKLKSARTLFLASWPECFWSPMGSSLHGPWFWRVGNKCSMSLMSSNLHGLGILAFCHWMSHIINELKFARTLFRHVGTEYSMSSNSSSLHGPWFWRFGTECSLSSTIRLMSVSPGFVWSHDRHVLFMNW